MGIRTVRLDDETEKVLGQITRVTGLSVSAALKRGSWLFTVDRRDFQTYRIRRGHRSVPVDIVG